MPTDPRTPVIVGVGQVVNHPISDDVSTWTEPLSLMTSALERAAEDASGVPGRRSSLLDRIDQLNAIPSFTWHVHDPAHAVAQGLRVAPASTRLAFAGGTTPQTLLFDASTRIAAGELDVAAIVGAEALRTRDLARRRDERVVWTEQDDKVSAAAVYGEVPNALTDHERSLGLAVPVHAYALFEHALRRSRGQSRAEHLERLGRLAARMSAVASTNDDAWIRDAHAPEVITTVSPTNRMVSLPYTKLLASNVAVDMGAAVILCSLSAARAAGVPDANLVFPQAGAAAREQWFISERAELSRSLAMRACAERLFGAGARSFDAVSLLDLYSCFPAVVQMAGDALGFDPWSDPRPPTVTGGMTFFGGPGNNYVTHSLATMARRLRASPGATGLVTALGWYCSTHAWGTYSSEPPRDGFRVHDVQAEVDAVPTRAVDNDFSGAGEVESYTVAYDRDGRPARAIVSVLTPAGARRLAMSEDVDVAEAIATDDPLGASLVVADGSISLV